jgi:hypothetical protein
MTTLTPADRGPAEPFAVEIMVSDPAGPRAAVGYPPFADAIPLADFTVPPVGADGPPAVTLELDCRDRPDAVELLAGGPGRARFQVSTYLRLHESGNGYIVVRVDRHSEEPTELSRFLETVLDPVLHGAAVTGLCELGGALVIARAQPRQDAVGVLCSVDREQLENAYDAALRNPRRLRYVAPGR